MSEKKGICGNKTVVAIGKFDGVHIGHRKLLDTASRLADSAGLVSVCLVIAPDTSITLLGKSERRKLVADSGIDCLYTQDLSKEFMSMSAFEFVKDYLIKKLNCAHVVVGYNFRFAKNRSANADDLKNICAKESVECTIVPEVKCMVNENELSASSSIIRSLIQNGKLMEASVLLGRNYSISGTVVHGKKLGRTIDFPTANIEAEPGRVIPGSGVYASYTYVDGIKHLSVTNIGDNPTVNKDGNITIESNILNFSSDIYGKNITVEFLFKIRDEIKFSSLEELKNQIEKDKESAKQNKLPQK